MAESLGSAFVEIHPETAEFSPEVLDAVNNAVGPAADRAGSLLTDAFTEAARSAEEALGTIEVPAIPVDAETTTAEESISALGEQAVEVPVDADTSSLVGEVDAALGEPFELTVVADATDAALGVQSSFDGLSIVVPIDIDAAPATAEVQEFGDTAQEAGSGVADLNTATAGFGAAAGIAGGSAAELGNVVGGLSGEAKAAVGAIAALASTAGLLFHGALDAQGATFRLDQALGDLAPTVETINVGSLNEDLSTLAVNLGSDDDEIRNAIASFVELGTASGATREEAAATAEQLVALAARARALNPELGSVGQIMEQLGPAFSRGGRFAAQFGIDLPASELAAAAAGIGKTTAELSIFEREQLGAQIATEKYGATLQQALVDGTENPILQLAKLRQGFSEFLEKIGAPLVAPVLRVLEELKPLAEVVAGALGEVIEALLPVVIELLPSLTRILTTLAPIIVEGAQGFAALVESALPLADILAEVIDLLSTGQGALSEFSLGTKQAKDEGTGFLAVLGSQRRAVEAILDPFIAYNKVTADVAVSTAALLDELARIDGLRLFITAEKNAAEATAALQVRLESLSDTHAAHATAIQADNKATSAFISDLLQGFQTEIDNFVSNVTSALPAVGDAFSDVAADIDSFVSTAVGALPSVGEAFTGAFDEANDAASPAKLLENLRDQEEALADFGENLRILAGRGFTALAEQLATQGPAVGGALAEAILNGGPRLAASLDEQVQITSDGLDDIAAEIDAFAESQGPQKLLEHLQEQAEAVAGFTLRIAALQQMGLTALAGELAAKGPEIGGALAKSILEGEPGLAIALNDQVEATQGALDESIDYFEEHGPELGLSAEDAAKAASLGMETNLDLVTPVSSEVDAAAAVLAAAGAVGGSLTKAAAFAATAAAAAAADVANDPLTGAVAAGTAFTFGLAAGISSVSAMAALIAAAAAAAQAAVDTVNDEIWLNFSPSHVAMDAGANFALGLALGIDHEAARVGQSAGLLAKNALGALDFGAPAFSLGGIGSPGWGSTPAAAGSVLATGPGGGMHMDVGGVTINYPSPERASESVPRELGNLAFLLGGT